MHFQDIDLHTDTSAASYVKQEIVTAVCGRRR